MLQWAFYDEDRQLTFLMYFFTTIFLIEVSVPVAFSNGGICAANAATVLTFRILQIRYLEGMHRFGCKLFVGL